MVHIALIIPIHNGLNHTKKCFEFLEECKKKAIQANSLISYVVVDDGSSDGSADWISNNVHNCIIIRGDGNLWWSGAINRGILYSLNNLKADYFLLWNNDIKPDSSYLYQLSTILKETNKNTIICSKVLFLQYPDHIFSMGGKFNPINGTYSQYAMYEKDSRRYNKVFEADWCVGMGTLIPKEVILKVGLFNDENFPQYHGDSDFGLRAKKVGCHILVYPELKIWNDKSNTGLSNDGSFRNFIKSLISLKSNNNIAKDFLFYKFHARSVLAYMNLVRKYALYIGGFFKWKFLGIFGIKRDRNKKFYVKRYES